LIYIDQLEELFALDHDSRIRRAFADALVALCRRPGEVRVVLSLRSDFLDAAAEHRALAELISAGVVMVGPADRDSLREALVLPAEMRGYTFESQGLVEGIIDELDGRPGALPLLQFAADQLWNNRDPESKLLTEDGYHAMGTVAGALGKHADQVIEALSSADQDAARTIFKRLVTGRETRDLVATGEIEAVLGSADRARRLLDYLVDQRLVAISREQNDQVVTLSHEALIDSWPTLRGWLDEGSEYATIMGEMRSAVRIWDGRGRPSGLLWKGDALVELRVALRRTSPKLTDAEQAFVAACNKQVSRDRVRRLSAVAGVMVLLLGVAVGASVAFLEVRKAEGQAKQAATDQARQAKKATEAAARAQQAEKQARKRFDDLQAETRARQKAEAKVAEVSEDVEEKDRELEMSNAELQSMVVRLRKESRKAKEAAEEARKARAAAEKLLAKEKRLRREAEKNQKDRATTLRK
jgi:hypothetical protein